MEKFKSFLLKPWIFPVIMALIIVISTISLINNKYLVIGKSLQLRQYRVPFYCSLFGKLRFNERDIQLFDLLTMDPAHRTNSHAPEIFDENSLSLYLASSMPNKIKGIPLEYDIEPDFSYQKMLTYAEKNNCLLRIRDLNGIIWKQDGDTFSGSFKVSTSYGFKARCLFQGEHNRITRMVFARKGSDKFEDGFAVFGCEFRKNVLDRKIDEIISQKIELPFSDNAEIISQEDPRDINICIDKENRFLIARTVISEELLFKILQKSYVEYGDDYRIFIFADQNLPDDKLKDLSGKIKAFGNLYRVYLDSKNKGRFVCVAKKL